MRKEKNRGGLYVAVFIAFIMVFSVIGFIVGDQEKYSYGKYSFSKKASQWGLRVEGKDLLFYYLPQDVENIAVAPEVKDAIINSQMVYITYSINDTQVGDLATAQFSLSQSLDSMGIFSRNGIVESQEGILQVSCSNSTPFVPVILIKRENSNSISLNNNCLLLSGDPIMTTDRLKYAIYGIIK